MTVLRMALIYLALVGLPAGGLWVILRLGEGLSAPPPIAGEWRVEPEGASGLAACLGALAGDDLGRVIVSQSGVFVTLAFGRESSSARVVGKLDGGALSARLELPNRVECPAARAVVHTAFGRDGDRELMRGSLEPVDCPACAIVEFEAVRREPPRAASH
jgi:hypothetical protein